MSDLDAIKEIEKIIGRKLKPYPADKDIINYYQGGYYLLNKKQQVIGLSLCNDKLTNYNFLKALPNLTQLNLSLNKISDIRVLKALPNLTQLNLSNNNLSNISALKALPNLTKIDLTKNKITELPKWLLDLNIPIQLDYNTRNGIYIGNNPIEQPPLEIIKKGNRAIRAYFEQIRKEGFDTIYEAKLILVGEGGAGKTSLANKIINPAWQLIPEIKSESTKGIDILNYQFLYKEKIFRVNIWDFGGQEIYHQTHQFFLSKRALYFLLADDRKEDTDFYHWLNIVDLLSANSPVLIIKNEKSNRSRDIPEQELKEFNNIQKILATDLNDNRGLPEIIKALQYYITDLPHIGSPLPKTWVKVREQLEQDSRYYIDLKEYFALCQANGFEKEADKLQLSEYLHDLGVCLHFQNHPLLRKTLILKPTWATDAVYKVLDNDTVKSQAGHFDDKDLADIWQDEQYSDMRGELLALMQKFKLCYEIQGQPQHYIAPQLLKDKAPIMTGSPLRTSSHGQDLLLRYQYDFMPKGILSQFIVEMHQYIAHNYEWVWKSGVILEKDKTQAEIIEYYGKREIYIRVVGQYKKELLNIVSYELDKINSSYERLKDKCKKLIPCLCKTCASLENTHFYDYEKLKKRISNKKYTVECDNSPYIEVDILKLIDGLDLTGFKNQSGLATKQTFIQIKTGDEIMTGENRTITTQNYIEGNVSGGNIAGRDINIQNSQGMSKEEFLKLLQELKESLPNSGLSADTIDDANDSLVAVEEQLSGDKPNQSKVKRKLEYLDGILEDASQTMETVEKGKEVFTKVVDTVKILVSAIATASFFL